MSSDQEQVIKFRASLEKEEARIAALDASLGKNCPPEMHRLIDIIGLDAALKLMIAMPGVTVTIPDAVRIPESINLASAVMAVLQKNMEPEEAAIHFQVLLSDLTEVVNKLRKHFKERARSMARLTHMSDRAEIQSLFKRLSKSEPAVY